MSKMTRRITLNPRIGNQSTLDWNHNWIVVKEGTELKEFKGEKTNQWIYRYTAEQIRTILEVNSVLEKNNQPLMTDEEIEHLLYPFGKETKIDTEDLQHLAGFRVEKTITAI
jgi:hypothetical protein